MQARPMSPASMSEGGSLPRAPLAQAEPCRALGEERRRRRTALTHATLTHAPGRPSRQLGEVSSAGSTGNAAMESFFSSLKVERVARKAYRTRDKARAGVSVLDHHRLKLM